MSEAFERCVAHVLAEEGGYVDHPRDPGGPTNRGITMRVLADWRGHDVTREDVRAMPEGEAMDIYRHRYWTPIRGDELPEPLALVTLDAAVNSGVSRASKWLQRAVKTSADGSVGPRTVAAASSCDISEAVMECCQQRMNFLLGLNTWSTFGRGWERRVSKMRAAALRMLPP